jgi:uracil-DNA glycosylase
MSVDTAQHSASGGAPPEQPGDAPSGAGALLDSRQRAMLQAMGITVWQPGVLVEKQPVAQSNRAQAAIKIIANQVLPVTSTAAVAAAALATPPARVAPPAGMAVGAPAVPRLPLPEGIDRMDWPALQAAVASCQACDLCTSRKNTVFGIGPGASAPELAPRADWLIVGEAPGEDEDAQGAPFAGAPGKLLDNMLRAMVINGQPLARHRNVFITNVLKCRPPADRNPRSAEVATCQPYLLRQIALLQPKIILAMGRFALQALMGSTEPLGKLRGRVHALQGSSMHTPVIVTYHPDYLLRNPGDKAKAWMDLLLAMETVEPTPPPA